MERRNSRDAEEYASRQNEEYEDNNSSSSNERSLPTSTASRSEVRISSSENNGNDAPVSSSTASRTEISISSAGNNSDVVSISANTGSSSERSISSAEYSDDGAFVSSSTTDNSENTVSNSEISICSSENNGDGASASSNTTRSYGSTASICESFASNSESDSNEAPVSINIASISERSVIGSRYDDVLLCRSTDSSAAIISASEEISIDNCSYSSSESDSVSSNNHNNESESIDEDLTNSLYLTDKMRSFLQSADCTDPINVPTSASPVEVILMVLKYAEMNSLSNTALANLFTLINHIFEGKIFPDSRYLIDRMFNLSTGILYHAVCIHCESYIGQYSLTDDNVVCNYCTKVIDVNNESFTNYFVTIDPTFEIENLIKSNATYYDEVTKHRIRDPNIVKDIFDGSEYQRIVNTLKNEGIRDYVTVIFSSDGAPVFVSSNYSIWPIQLIVNEVPPEIRFSSTILTALWFGQSKPSMDTFLVPFVKIMNELTNVGFSCTINGENRQFKVVPVCCCADSVARAPMQGLTQFNGYFGCNWCLHPGEYIGGSMRYVLQDHPCAKRKHDESIQHIAEAVDTFGSRVYGFKTASQLIKLIYFDIIDGFVPDYLHNVALGIVEQFLMYWLQDPQTYTLVNNPEACIKELLKTVKIHIQAARRVRTLKHKMFFKGREWENWLLLNSLFILRYILREEYFNHWSKLVEAIYTLLQPSIYINSIEHADILLHEFVGEVEELYGVLAMTYNVHQLLHMADSVFSWGPLWCHNGFSFESGNYSLLQKIHAAKGVCNQICRAVALSRSAKLIKSIISEDETIIADHFNDRINPKITVNCIKVNDTRYFGKSIPVNDNICEQFEIEIMQYESYLKIVKNGCVYSTCLKVNRRTNNSFAQLVDGTYVCLQEFLVNETTGTEITIGKKLAVSNLLPNSCPMYQKVNEISQQLSSFSTKDISKPCVYVKIFQDSYICSLPNLYHYS